MLDKYQDMKDEFDQATDRFENAAKDFSRAADEISEHAQQTLGDFNNVNIIISDIDKQFSEKTGIGNPKDMAFLWGAVAVQCVRWIVIPTLNSETLNPTREDRKDSSEEGKKDPALDGRKLDKTRDEWSNQRFPDTKSIMILPVPYDAMIGTNDIVIPGVSKEGKQISPSQHHAATLGHDPIIGQVIGTANIMTRSITFNNPELTTRKVEIPSGRTQIVVPEPYPIGEMLMDVGTSMQEDINRLKAGVLKENLHLQSDKYAKIGLPIPLLSAEMQNKLLEQNWNTNELENVFKGAVPGIGRNLVVTVVINMIVGILHALCYDEQKDGDWDLYRVRTRKIQSTSNVIAESIDIGAIAVGTGTGIMTGDPELSKESITHVDIGGIIEAIHQIFRSKTLQETIRREFLEQELFNRFVGYEYSFLKEEAYEQEKNI